MNMVEEAKDNSANVGQRDCAAKMDSEKEVRGDESRGTEVDVPYSVYMRKEKWMIVGMVALAGFYR